MRNEISLTDEQLEQIFSELGYHVAAGDLIFTRDSIDDFEKSAGRNPRRVEINGLETLESSKGLAIDFGSVRAFAN